MADSMKYTIEIFNNHGKRADKFYREFSAPHLAAIYAEEYFTETLKTHGGVRISNADGGRCYGTAPTPEQESEAC